MNNLLLQGECTGKTDDRVKDTPKSKPSYGCPAHNLDTCPQQPGKDAIRNYMGCK